MNLKAIVPFDGGVAHYSISSESNGIYQARLLQYEGNSGKEPPAEVILVRGYRHWSGSYDRQELLNEIGNVIESRNLNGDSFAEANKVA